MGAIPLSAEDIAKVEAWKRSKALVKVDPEKLRMRTAQGFIWVGCGDGDHQLDVPEFLVHKIGCSRRFHNCGWNGGAFRLDPTLDIPKRYAQPWHLLEELRDAREAKGIEILLLDDHFVCGVGRKLGLTIEQLLLSVSNAALYVGESLRWDRQNIITTFRVCWSESVRETYYANVSCADDVYDPLRGLQLV